MLPEIVPVILAGGEGRRLRPLSHPARPKPFLSPGRGPSLLQATVLRARDWGLAAPVVVCNTRHQELVRAQLQNVSIKPAHIFCEPLGRGTAPAVAAVAHYYAGMKVDPLLMVIPSDHVMKRPEVFRDVFPRAAEAAYAGHIVMFGITPSRPAAGYGYIRAGADQDILSFIEKPPVPQARRLIREGGWLWNSGIFLMSTSIWRARLGEFDQRMNDESAAAVARARRLKETIILDEAAFGRCPAGSIDKTIVERMSDGRKVMPVDPGWRDVGTWPEFIAGIMDSFRNRTGER